MTSVLLLAIALICTLSNCSNSLAVGHARAFRSQPIRVGSKSSLSMSSEDNISDFAKGAIKKPKVEAKEEQKEVEKEKEEEPSAPGAAPAAAPQQEIIAFDDYISDFAKDDIKKPKEKEVTSLLGLGGPDKSKTGQMKLNPSSPPMDSASLEKRLQDAYEKNLARPREDGWIENPNRPTGYGIPDENDNEEEMKRQMQEDIESGKYQEPTWENRDDFKRWLKDTYVGSPYDSRKKKQARSVVRNITVISIGIGIIFTAIWYAFPGKFINVRGADPELYQARYETVYTAPDELMRDSFNNDKDDGPGQAEQTRFGEQRNAPPLRGSATLDL